VSESLIIIGAGIAGLSAGCYGQMNGYRTRIFEMHDKPGGLCTAWKRKGYTFDGCVHWLTGSGEGAEFNRMWQELGAVQGRRFIDYEVFQRIEGGDGRALSMYTDIDRLEEHMKELSPSDSATIDSLCSGARHFARLGAAGDDADGKPGVLGRIREIAGMLQLAPLLLKYGRMAGQELAQRFGDPFLGQAVVSGFRGMPECPALMLMMLLGSMHSQAAGYPVGGSLELARAIERRYLDLGGEIHYRSRVERILVQADPAGRGAHAVGVRLRGGSEHRADVVVSAADGRTTIFDMLEGKYATDKVRSYYAGLPVSPSCTQVSLGVARDLSDMPHTTVYQLDEPLRFAGTSVESMAVRHFCQDPSMAPPGKSAVVVEFFTHAHAYWSALHEQPETYEAEKADLARKVIDQLERRLPGISEQIEVVDVSTPVTTETYTGNWQGSMMGWMVTTDTLGLMLRGMRKTLPGLKGFYMAGQWVEPGGGLPTAAASGRDVIRAICKKDGKPFETQLP
jgi:phytoene dehydrogenase-like protein